MARSKSPSRAPSKSSPQAANRQSSDAPAQQKESWRDTLESIVFAFVLAFLFRTFEAEAFVIPTGSMAPTLYGRHKECECRQCGFNIVVGASDEVDPDTGYLQWSLDGQGHYERGPRIQSAVCSNCGYENVDLESTLAFNGDRILVNKYPYEFSDPDRFDVFVFKWPEKPETNYIKRLVGLPNEIIRIKQGDLYLWDPDAAVSEQILRKAPDKQRALQLMLYDDAFPPRELNAAGWPERWHGMRPAAEGELGGWADSDGWTMDAEGRTYAAAETAEPNWLRYRHYLPRPFDWETVEQGQPLKPVARLVSDFCGYNAYTGEGLGSDSSSVDTVDYGPFWVTDLTVNFELRLDTLGADSAVLLELVDGVRSYRCRIDPDSGEASLLEVRRVAGELQETELATAATSITGPGDYSISFANVDDRICLWIDDSLVEFGDGATYTRHGLGNNTPTNNDLTPIGIAVQNAAAQVSELVVQRDIYYRAQKRMHNDFHFWRMLTDNLDDPAEWFAVYQADALEFDQLDLEVGPDHYLALGDNSPRSSDSRLWNDDRQTVPRSYLVGKAFFTYWPHGVPFMNDGQGYPVWWHKAYSFDQDRRAISTANDYPKYTVPFYPQFQRMHRIR